MFLTLPPRGHQLIFERFLFFPKWGRNISVLIAFLQRGRAQFAYWYLIPISFSYFYRAGRRFCVFFSSKGSAQFIWVFFFSKGGVIFLLFKVVADYLQKQIFFESKSVKSSKNKTIQNTLKRPEIRCRLFKQMFWSSTCFFFWKMQKSVNSSISKMI